MKKQWIHPEEPLGGKRYWRSINELEDTPQFRDWLEREFPQGAAEMANEADAGDSRRSFLKLMGAATALAGFGMAGCRRPESKILPYVGHVEWMIPGKPLFYATARPRGKGAVPMVVTTHDGRPTHLQGNHIHPTKKTGALDPISQATILDFYDPQRSRAVLQNGQESDLGAFEAALKALRAEADKNAGADMALLVGECSSPTRARLLAELTAKWTGLKIYEHESVSCREAELANEGLFGAGMKQIPLLDKADIVLSLDCDFLGLDAPSDNPSKGFSDKRRNEKPGDPMNRLYVVENRYTLTGGMADHRLPLAASQVINAAAYLAGKLGVGGVESLVAGLPKRAEGSKNSSDAEPWLTAAAEDLLAHKGRALVLAGSWQPAAVHVLVAQINQALGSFGATIATVKSDLPKYEGIQAFAERANAGQIKAAFILGDHDAAFTAAGNLNVPTALAKIGAIVHLGCRIDTTASKARWHVPMAHWLESWGDVRSLEGVYSIVQPMIAPLYNGLSELELILALLGRKTLVPVSALPAAVDAKTPAPAGQAPPAPATPTLAAAPAEDVAYAEVRNTFGAISGGTLDELKWSQVLRDGYLEASAYPAATAALNAAGTAGLLAAAKGGAAPSENSFEVVFTPDHKVWDGRHINNGWLQEMPDPITKITWDNAAWINPSTFKALGLQNDGDLIRVEVNGQSLTIPAIATPGHARNSITLPLGYGQGDFAGQVGYNTGFNVNVLRGSANPYFAVGAKVAREGGTYVLVTTAEHYSMKGRALMREGTVEDYKTDPTFAQVQGMDSHIPENISLYRGQVGVKTAENPHGFDYEHHHQWGMTIDLGTCIGCNSCLVACQSENNIPIVGKDQVRRHREMHWIRLDRYFATTDTVESGPSATELDNPEMLPQPVMCQHCESAPCETVCPVNATVHNEEGLNLMVYNRCIGTRYCANNCPYKVRHFNFFDYNKRPLDELYRGPLSTQAKTGTHPALALQKNPNVTVRMRGVIEKCTYCIQRTEEAKIKQRRVARDSNNVRVPADAVKTACQVACPTEAIAFGDLANPESSVVKIKKNPRNYDLLKYIGTLPRTSYLARIKNPNPAFAKVPGSEMIGAATKAHHAEAPHGTEHSSGKDPLTTKPVTH